MAERKPKAIVLLCLLTHPGRPYLLCLLWLCLEVRVVVRNERGMLRDIGKIGEQLSC